MSAAIVARQQRKRSTTVDGVSRKKLSFSNFDPNNTAEVNVLYEECVEHIHKGLHPVSRQTAIKLAAIEYFVLYGPYREGVDNMISAENLMPKEYTKAKNHEKNIREQYRELLFNNKAAAMRNYCDICRSLPTYGLTFFLVKEPVGGKLVTRLFGVNKECVMSVDAKSKVVLKSWPLEQLRRWGASPNTFNIDFGDYQDGYYSVKTNEGEKIKRLIAEFVDIILKKKQLLDPFGLDGDEGAIMIEQHILPGRVKQLVFPRVEEGETVGTPLTGTPPVSGKFPSADFQKTPSPPLVDGPSRPKVFAPMENVPPARTVIPAEIPPPAAAVLQQKPQPPVQPQQQPLQVQPPTWPPSLLEASLPPPPESYSPSAPSDVPTIPELPMDYGRPERKSPPRQPPVQYQQQTFIQEEVFRKPPQIAPIDAVPAPHRISPDREKLQPRTVLPYIPPTIVESERMSSVRSDSRSSHYSSREVRYEISIKNGVASKSINHQFVSSSDFQQITTTIQESQERTRRSAEILIRPFHTLDLPDEQREVAVEMGQELVQRKMLVFVACAAQIIEWTSKGAVGRKEDQVSEAVSTMTTNLEDLNVCIWELCSVLNKEDVGPVIQLTNGLSDAFVDFLDKLDPNKAVKRSAFLASASKIGETSFYLLNALNEDEEEAISDHKFYTAMNEAIQGVASTTAALILQTKNIPQPTGAVSKLSSSATEVAVLTSELIALARILAPIIGHPTCQQRVSASTQKVEDEVRALVSEMFTYCAATRNPDLIDDIRKKAGEASVAMQMLVKQIQE